MNSFLLMGFFSDSIQDADQVDPKSFVKFVIDENKKNLLDLYQINEHWRPQITACPFCSIPFLVYGKYEAYAEDTAYILHQSNLTQLRQVGFINSASGSQSTSKKERRTSFWSKVPAYYLKDLLHIFKPDFEMFQYF